MPKYVRFLFAIPIVALLVLTGCTSTRTGETEMITVEGTVTVRGNEPFTAVFLQTKEDNWYILDLTQDQRNGLVNPSIQRAIGAVYLGDWNGTPFTHLRVSEIARVTD